MIRSTLNVTKHTPSARALVAAEHPLGAEVGAGILARGGNAVDAAVATAFAMTVVEPFMSSVAGGGTMLVHLARRGETIALDFNVQAPAACHESCYELGEGVAQALFPWRKVVGDANNFGPKSVAIPGSVAGLCLALERYGTMDLADVLAPAIALAEKGFEVDWYHALTIAAALRRARRLPRDRAHLPARRPLRVPAGLERARRRAAPAGPGSQPAAHRQGRPRGVLSRRDRPGHRRGDAAHRRLPAGERPRGLRPARGRAPDHEVSPARAGLLARRHRRADRGRDAEHPGPVPLREGRVRDAGRAPPASGGDPLRLPRPAAPPGRSARGARALARAGLERARAGGGGGPPGRRPAQRRQAAGRVGARRGGRRRRARDDGGGAAAGGGCPPTATTAPRTSARWTASATWSR